MKNAQTILSHIRSNPSFRKLGITHCLARLTELLPPQIGRMVRFSYVKNNTLFFVLSHPAAKMEFDNIIRSIKSPLKMALDMCDKELGINDFKAFVSHKAPQKNESKPQTFNHFTERANANFENHFSDTRLYTLFEEIRTIIHDRNT